jgi:tetratricopeptide (TPR) repeat protein
MMSVKPIKAPISRPHHKGVDVNPAAIRQARLEAGLSLAAVADGHVTRAAIHLVEVGKSRPSRQTLELIAHRTGKPVSFFLAGTSPRISDRSNQGVRQQKLPELSELERLALAEDPQALREHASALLERVHDPRREGQLRYYLGRAQVQLSEPQAAQVNLHRAGEIFSQLNDAWMVVECMDWEAGALYLLERPEALELTQRALRQCRDLSPIPITTEVRILGHIAAIHVSRHEWTQAISVYEQALGRAGALRDLARMARMYNDLSIAYQEMGDLAQAGAYSHKALALHEMQNNREALAFSENNLALVLMKQGQVAAAESHLRKSLAVFEELGLDQKKSHVLLSLSELSMTRRDSDEARWFAEGALELAERNHEPMTLALAHQALGQLAAAGGDPKRSDAEFELALGLLTPLKVVERLVECHTKYAAVLEARGDNLQALKHLKLAVACSHPTLALVDTVEAESSA